MSYSYRLPDRRSQPNTPQTIRKNPESARGERKPIRKECDKLTYHTHGNAHRLPSTRRKPTNLAAVASSSPLSPPPASSSFSSPLTLKCPTDTPSPLGNIPRKNFKEKETGGAARKSSREKISGKENCGWRSLLYLIYLINSVYTLSVYSLNSVYKPIRIQNKEYIYV